MTRLELVQQKIKEIKKYNGLELVLYSNDFKKTKGLIMFEIKMVTNFQNMELYKLEKLIQDGFIEKTETSGRNRVTIYFK